jgi:hypothetical protein
MYTFYSEYLRERNFFGDEVVKCKDNRRDQILMIMKNVTPCSAEEICRRFGKVFFHHQGKEVRGSVNCYQTIRHHIPENSVLRKDNNLFRRTLKWVMRASTIII